MTKAPIFSLFACALLVGWFAPDLPTSGASETDSEDVLADAHAEADQVRLAAARDKAWAAGQTVLTREGDGHFYATVSLDSGSVRFLVDTGASMVALTGADAAALGLDWQDSELRPIGRGASGTVYGVPARIARMELDGIEATNVEAAIIPEGLDVSLLGQSFLRRAGRVEIEGDAMMLGG